MKTLKNIFAVLVFTSIFASCTPTTDINEETQTEFSATEGGDDSDQDDGKD